MPVKSLSLTIPDTRPYDRQDTWFESFIGGDLRPIIETISFRRFWFTRYGAVGQGKTILFRFEIDHASGVDALIDGLRKKFLGQSSYGDYDFAGDIGKGQNSRFLGVNSVHQDPARRGDIAFDFLHGAARLFVDCLDGPDADGYWKLETETASGFSVMTSMEQFHHLFCNLSGVPTFVAITAHPGIPGHQVMSYEEFKHMRNQDQTWQLLKLVRVTF